jgi:membrane protein implicated in regulation of membrane protease activity
MLLLLAILALLLAPEPWNLIAFAAGLVLWVGEVAFWYRTVRHRRRGVGVETLVGRSAEVISPCVPDGQVRLVGESEIWRARCVEGARIGETVRVTGVDGLTLIVEIEPRGD